MRFLAGEGPWKGGCRRVWAGRRRRRTCAMRGASCAGVCKSIRPRGRRSGSCLRMRGSTLEGACSRRVILLLQLFSVHECTKIGNDACLSLMLQ